MDWLIVGLGNPGREYARTRHNVGFSVARELAQRWDLGAPRKRYRGCIAEGRASRAAADAGAGSARPRVAVLCPQTYMNDAGRSVGPARGALRLPLERVLVMHDEIDLPFGEVRARVGGGLAGHNGLKSLAAHLGGTGFARVRVGVGRPDSSDPQVVSAHVLARFDEDEAAVAQLIAHAGDAVEDVIFAEQPDL